MSTRLWIHFKIKMKFHEIENGKWLTGKYMPINDSFATRMSWRCWMRSMLMRSGKTVLGLKRMNCNAQRKRLLWHDACSVTNTATETGNAGGCRGCYSIWGMLVVSGAPPHTATESGNAGGCRGCYWMRSMHVRIGKTVFECEFVNERINYSEMVLKTFEKHRQIE